MFELLISNGTFTIRKGAFTTIPQDVWQELSNNIIDWNERRLEKDYQTADRILNEIEQKGFTLKYHGHYAHGEKLENPYFTLENIYPMNNTEIIRKACIAANPKREQGLSLIAGQRVYQPTPPHSKPSGRKDLGISFMRITTVNMDRATQDYVI